MKAVILILTWFTGISFAQGATGSHIVTKDRFSVLTNIPENNATIFLSYSGRWIGQCGIRIKTNFFISGEELNQVLAITNMNSLEVGEVEPAALVAKVDPDLMSFGALFVLQSRSGSSIADAIKSLSPSHDIEAIVENLPCED